MVANGSTASITDSLAPLGLAGRATIIHAAGDLTDSPVIDWLLRRFGRVMVARPLQVIVDLHEVETADTKLIAALVLMHRIAHVTEVGLVLRLSPCILTWLSVCRLEWLADGVEESRAANISDSEKKSTRLWRTRPAALA